MGSPIILFLFLVFGVLISAVCAALAAAAMLHALCSPPGSIIDEGIPADTSGNTSTTSSTGALLQPAAAPRCSSLDRLHWRGGVCPSCGYRCSSLSQ
jgi:hypothetical protein